MIKIKANIKVLAAVTVLYLIAVVLMILFKAPAWMQCVALFLELDAIGTSILTEMGKYKLAPKIHLWSLLVLGIAVIAMFFLGGSSGTLEVAGDFLNVPKYSDLFLSWIYILLGLAVLITLCVMILKLCSDFKYNPKRAIRSLCVVAGAVVLCIICWMMGSPEELHIVGYEGTDNVGFWAQMADAVMYLVYILFIATIGAVIAGALISGSRK